MAMAQTVESLVEDVLGRLKFSSLSEVVATLPSALTTGVLVRDAEAALKAGHQEEAFHFLSLTHSTLLHHRMALRLHKPKQQEGASDCPEELLKEKKSILSPATTSTAETMKLLQKLPPEWTVVQLTSQRDSEELFKAVDSKLTTPSLYLSRCTCGPNPNILVQAVAAPPNVSVKSILQEFADIRSNIKGTFGGTKENSNTVNANSKEGLNARMENMVESMEAVWLRHWSCLLMGSLPPAEEKLLDAITSRILSAHSLFLTDSERHCFKCIISCPVVSEVRDQMRAGLRALLKGKVAGEHTVKEICASINNGKEILTSIRKAVRNPVILVLDKSVVGLPWEMMSVMKNQPVTRVPSLVMLALLYEHHSKTADSVLVKGVNTRKGFYVLDPEGNLPRTQKRLKKVLEGTGWQGITAQVPSHEEFSSALNTSDIFLYSGHGSGSQYLPGDLVDKVSCRAVVLLYGCSSVHMLPRGRIVDPWGVVMNYFVAYCPCVVGMLWDVTDRDVDQITSEMVQYLQTYDDEDPTASPLGNCSDVALLMAKLRVIPRHYLMASALCVYGLPLHLANTDLGV